MDGNILTPKKKMKLTSATWLTIIAMFFFALPTLYLVMAEPIIGLADNGDFYRVTNKEGIKHRDDLSYHDRYFHNPVRKFKLEKPETGAGDYKTSFTIMIKASLLLNKLAGESKLFDIRFMGLTNATFFLFAIFLILLSIRTLHFCIKFCIISMLFMMFIDASRICYFNSFYAESGSLFFLLVTIFLALTLVLEPLSHKRALILTALYFSSSILLSSSKQQHVLLIFPLVLWGAIFLSYLNKKDSVKRMPIAQNKYFLSSAILLTITVSVYFFFSTGNINKKTSLYNVVFYSLLPHAEDPQQALVELGMDLENAEKYKEYSGTWSWSENTIVDDSEFRSAFFANVDLFDVIKFHFFHPEEVARLVVEESRYFGSTRSHYLEYIEKTTEPSSVLIYEVFSGWSNFKEKLDMGWKSLMGFYFFNFGLIAIKFFKFDRTKQNKLITWLHLSIIFMSILEFVTCILGDRGDDAKIYFLFSVMLDICLIFIFVYAISLVLAHSNKQEYVVAT